MAVPQAGGRVHVERLQRDGAAALGTDEARAIVERDAPELLALLEELKDSLTELRSRVGPVLAQVPPVAVVVAVAAVVVFVVGAVLRGALCIASAARWTQPVSLPVPAQLTGIGAGTDTHAFSLSAQLCRVQVEAGELATAEGLSYLEAKHLLLLSYCTHIVFYVLLKAEGAPVRDHPVIGRLLQLRTYLVRRLLGAASCCMVDESQTVG
jgi:Sas10/Utp3/C1D family